MHDNIAYLTGLDIARYPRPLLMKKCCNANIYAIRTIIGYSIHPGKKLSSSFNVEPTRPSAVKFSRILAGLDPTKFIHSCKRLDNSYIGYALINELIIKPFINRLKERNVFILNTIGALAAKYSGKKVIIDLMDLWTCRTKEIRFNVIDYVALRKADYVIAWSQAIKNILLKLGIRNVGYVPFGIDLRVFDPLRVSEDLFFERYKDLKGKVLVGYSGGMWFVDGIDRLGVEKIIQAFRYLEKNYKNDIVLVFQTSRNILSTIKKYGIKNYVYINPTSFNNSLRLSLLRALDIKVLTATEYPAVYFAERSTMFQYMASGSAILAESTPGARGVLKHGYNAYLVNLNDIKSMAEGLAQLVEDKKLRERLGFNARKDIEEKYSWDILSGRVKTIIENVFD